LTAMRRMDQPDELDELRKLGAALVRATNNPNVAWESEAARARFAQVGRELLSQANGEEVGFATLRPMLAPSELADLRRSAKERHDFFRKAFEKNRTKTSASAFVAPRA
jgi:hypothetical protein